MVSFMNTAITLTQTQLSDFLLNVAIVRPVFIWVVSLSSLDGLAQAQETGVPNGPVDRQTALAPDTTATRQSSRHDRSIRLPSLECAAASAAVIRCHALARTSATPAANCHGAKLNAYTPATTTTVFPAMAALY